MDNNHINDYPIHEPKKVTKNSITNSQSQTLNKCSSVSESTSLRYAIERVSGRQRLKRREGVRIRKLIRVKSTKSENKNKQLSSENTRVEDLNHVKNDHILNENFTRKYQPRVFADISGHEITIMALSKATKKMQIASLYLFYGPTGTGKTSTARIFAMALNCKKSLSPKPCWSCRGCSRSLFIMELCSGNRGNGFEKIKTLLENTSFSKSIPGFKVIIIKQCHLFDGKEWDELLGMAERAYVFGVVFVIVTVSANIVPLNILSRCQKFCFPKLTNTEITSKLLKIADNEDIRVNKEAFKMIAVKAEGSLREAENLLDQLALFSSSITGSMVQKLVGLLPQNKLVSLLEMVVSGDSIKTMRYTTELVASGVEPKPLVSQLAGLVSDILSDDARSASSSKGSSKYNLLLRRVHQPANSQLERFCYALKVLVETEKQLRCSGDQNTILMASLLDITSQDFSNRISLGNMWQKKESPGDTSTVTSEDLHNQSIFLGRSNSHSHSISSNSEQLEMKRNLLFIPTDDNNQSQSLGTADVKTILPNMEDIWRKTLREIQNGYVKEFLLQAKLASLTVSRGNIIVHLMFKKAEDKRAAQMSEITIKRVLQTTIGCDVTLNMSTEPIEMGISETDSVLTKNQSYKHTEPHPEAPYLAEVFHSMSFKDVKNQSTPRDYSPSVSQRATKSNDRNIYAMEKQNKVINNKAEFDASIDSLRETIARQRALDRLTNRCLSISSLEQSDASVEPYSRDILFDKVDRERRGNGSRNRKFRKGFLKYVENRNFPNRAMNQRWNYFGGCREVLCSRQSG